MRPDTKAWIGESCNSHSSEASRDSYEQIAAEGLMHCGMWVSIGTFQPSVYFRASILLATPSLKGDLISVGVPAWVDGRNLDMQTVSFLSE
jgi:hypothetical protein